jgi:hypothetical protein
MISGMCHLHVDRLTGYRFATGTFYLSGHRAAPAWSTGKKHASGGRAGPHHGCASLGPQLVDLPINTRGIAMPRAAWSHRLAILQHGSNMRAHSCFPGTKIE